MHVHVHIIYNSPDPIKISASILALAWQSDGRTIMYIHLALPHWMKWFQLVNDQLIILLLSHQIVITCITGTSLPSIDQSDKIESLRSLFVELKEIGSWEHLCLNLRVSRATVNALTYERANNNQKMYRCLEAFYNEDTEPGVEVSWKTVVKAVYDFPISNTKLAKKIAKKHNIDIDIINSL